MLSVRIAVIALLFISCQRATDGPTVWALQSLPAENGSVGHRIVPTRPWWDIGGPPETWAEVRPRPDGVRLVLLSTAKHYLEPKMMAHDEPFVVDAPKEAQRQYRAVRLAGGQQWLCSPGMTRYLVEQLRSGRPVTISRPSGELFCRLQPGGFRSCWESLRSQGFGLEAAAILPAASDVAAAVSTEEPADSLD
jgi:hypothetical protein